MDVLAGKEVLAHPLETRRGRRRSRCVGAGAYTDEGRRAGAGASVGAGTDTGADAGTPVGADVGADVGAGAVPYRTFAATKIVMTAHVMSATSPKIVPDCI